MKTCARYLVLLSPTLLLGIFSNLYTLAGRQKNIVFILKRTVSSLLDKENSCYIYIYQSPRWPVKQEPKKAWGNKLLIKGCCLDVAFFFSLLIYLSKPISSLWRVKEWISVKKERRYEIFFSQPAASHTQPHGLSVALKQASWHGYYTARQVSTITKILSCAVLVNLTF